MNEDSPEIGSLFALSNILKGIYSNLINNEQNPSDTLITKVLLGTMGCAPAYD